MLKKIMAGILSLALIFSMTACVSAAGTAPDIELVNLTWCGASPTGLWTQAGTMILEIVKEVLPDLRYTVVAGGGYANPIVVAIGDANLGLTFTSVAASVMNGLSPYKEQIPDGAKQLRALIKIDSLAAGHFVVTKALADKYGLKSVKDIADKKVPLRLNAGQPGSGDEAFTSALLACYGVTFDDIRSWGGQLTTADYAEAADRYINGQCDGIGFNEVIGLADIVELASARDSVFLTIEPEIAKQLAEKFGYLDTVVPAGTYPGQEEEVTMAYHLPLVIIRADIPEEQVYYLTKTILQNRERLVMTHAFFNDFHPETAWKDIAMPLHPGAERAYKELGFIK